MVAQDSPSSVDLDDSIIAFGQWSSEEEKFEKVHYENLFEQESTPEEEMSYNNPGRSANETPNIAEHPGEKVICKEQSMWHEEEKEGKTAFNEKYQGSILIEKESGEDEYFNSTDETQHSNLITQSNPFIDQEMDYETAS